MILPVVVALLSSCTYMSGTTLRVEPDRTAAPLTSDFFGMHVARVGDDNAYWPSVGSPSVRLWDTSTTWRDLQPTRTTWDWTRLDANVGRAERNHASVLLTLGMTPQWASARPREASNYGAGASAEPRDMGDFARYVSAVVARYKGRISAYEIWNEPIFPSYYTGTAAKMGSLTHVAHDIIKSVDPKALVVAPAVYPNATAPAWLDAYLRTGAARFFDVASVHLYKPTPEGLPGSYEPVRKVLERYNLTKTKPVWDTETGYRVIWKTPAALGRPYVARTYVLAAAAGFSRLYWYAWDNVSWVGVRLVQPDRATPTAAGLAYRDTYTWLNGATVLKCNGGDRGNGLWQCPIKRGTRSSVIMWNASRQSTVIAPRGTVQVRYLNGHTWPFHAGDRVSIGAEPAEFVLG